MTIPLPILLILLGLGAVQLAVGVVLGRCLPARRKQTPRPELGNVGRMRQLAQRLYELVNGVSDDVDVHRGEIDRVQRELASVESGRQGGLTDVVLKTVARTLQINERLQTRLTTAEQQLQEQSRQIESQLSEARTDPLTGLPNRRAFDDVLVRRIAERHRGQTPLSLLMIDLDDFKRLNDRHGHPAGDHALQHVAEVLSAAAREMDLVARVGGEEFAVILPATPLADGKVVAERMRRAIGRKSLHYEKTALRVTASLGLASAAGNEDGAALIKRADEALYAAKQAGRNRGCFHDGRACQPIRAADDAPPPAIDPLAAVADAQTTNLADAEELAVLCGRLRDRLAELE